MLEEKKTPLTLAVMAKAAELAPNVGDQYETDRLIRIKNVSGSVFTQYQLYRVGVLAPIVGFGDTSTKSDPNWWLASQLLDLDTKGLENAKAGEEKATIDIERVQSLIDQILSIQINHPNCDVTATIDPDGSLEVAAILGRDHDHPTTITIIELPESGEGEIPAEKFLDLYLYCSKLSSGYLKRGMIVLETGNGGEYLAITKCKKDSPKFRLYKNTLTADNLQSLQENYNSLCELVGYDPNKENTETEANDLQTQIEAIKKQYPHCDIEARVDPDGKLRMLSAKGREGSSTTHDDPTVVTIVNCDPPTKEVKECPVAKESVPTQEQLKAIFNHVTNLTAEEAEALGFQYSLMARTNFPRIELQIVSFSKYGNNKDEWKCTIVHQSPTDPLREQYSFQSSYDFETTCHRLWWPIKCKEWEVEESQQEFISLPVAEFQELQSQIKEVVDSNQALKTELTQVRAWLNTLIIAYGEDLQKNPRKCGRNFRDTMAKLYRGVADSRKDNQKV